MVKSQPIQPFLKGYAPLVISFILWLGVIIVGLFHMEERGFLFYTALAVSSLAFTLALLDFFVRALRELLEDYRRRKSVLGLFYDFFSSIKLAVFIMIALGILSMLGSTYIQQNQPIEFYLDRFGADLGLWFWKLWLTDVFSSWYYIAFIILLAVNLIVCSIKRLPRVWVSTFTKERFQRLDEHMQKHLKPIEIHAKVSPDRLGAFLNRLGFKVYVQEEGDRVYMYGEKGRYSRLGVYIVHIGLLVIMAGALLDALTGIRGTVIVVEGSKSDVLRDTSRNKAYQLPFQIQVDKFYIITYEEEARRKGKKVDPSIKNAVASFESDLRIIENGVEVAKGKTAVNSPFDYKGYRIFQATYGLTGEVGKVKLAVFDRERLSKEKDPKSAFMGDLEVVNGKVAEFKDMLIAIDRSTINIEDENKGMQGELKPAVMLKVLKDRNSHDVPVVYSPELTTLAYFQLQKLRDFPYIFFMVEAEPQYFSGLQVSKKPGTWVIWLGSILVVGGMLLAFYTVHRKVWVRLEGGKMLVAFWSHKLKEEFKKSFIRELEALKHESASTGK